jgi:HPt (histidine-containing phosphotransfer) domain-containing protein
MTQASGTLIDRDVLDRQTMGDRGLALELLSMFAEQVEAAMLELNGCSVERRMALGHALKGTARSLGIQPVAACAAELEMPQPPEGALPRLALLAARLRSEVEARSRPA